MATKADIRTFVRDYFEFDASDLPDALIDAWTIEGVRRIQRAKQTWPAYFATDTFVTEVGVSEYNLGYKEVSAVYNADYQLDATDRWYADDRYRSWSPGHPMVFVPTRTGVRLYPDPDGAYTFNVVGYRAPADPTLLAAGDLIDLPTEDSADVLSNWVIHKAYLFEDEPEMAGIFKTQFEEGLARIMRDEDDQPTGPIVMNGNAVRRHTMGTRIGPWVV